MRVFLPLLLALTACEPSTVRVAGLTLDLYTPSDTVDPMDGADTLVVRVVDAEGNLVEEGSAAPGQPLPIPAITQFGLVEIEVTARAGGRVLSAARSGLVDMSSGDERELPLLFLPVNEAVPLTWRPNAQRFDHAALSLEDGEVLIVGGRDPDTRIPRGDSEIWSTRTGFGGDGPLLPSSLSDVGVTQLDDGSWILAGGETGSTTSALVLHVSADGEAVRSLPNLPEAEADPCLATHPKLGAVVLSANHTSVYNDVGRVGEEDEAWGDIGGCAGQDGYVVVAGSSRRWGILDLTDDDIRFPFDVESNGTWFDDLPALRDMHVVPLPDGSFFLGGGYGFEASRTARIADPSRREIAEYASLEHARADGHAAAWRDGLVVLAGGWADASDNEPVRFLDLHDPVSGPVSSIATPVSNPTMSLLRGGAVLLTGGSNAEGEPAGAYAVMPWPGDDG